MCSRRLAVIVAAGANGPSAGRADRDSLALICCLMAPRPRSYAASVAILMEGRPPAWIWAVRTPPWR